MTRAFFDAVHADPWSHDLVDLPSLNARASGAIEEAIERVRSLAQREPRALRSTSLVVLGPPGAGKTHLFARLRRRVGPRAVFVHVRPLVHAEMTPRFLLGEIVRQLAFLTPQDIAQASALVASLLGQLGGVGAAFPMAVLSEYADLPSGERARRLEATLERVLELWPDVDESYLKRLLAVPFAPPATRRALLAWLSGRDCDAAQLERIGAGASIAEEQAFAALRTLSAVAALGSPLVVVFDQLENLMDAEGAGPRLRAYAHLAAECVDTLRGMVLVHLALDSEWDRGIEPSFNLAQRSRIVMRRELLALPRAAEREQLLRLFFERAPEPREAFPWPLGDAWLGRLKSEPGITPRMLLLEFRRALDGEGDAAADVAPASAAPDARGGPAPVPATPPPPSAVPVARDLDAEWQRSLASAREVVHAAGENREPVDAARLADGLLAAGRFLPDLRLRPEPKPPAHLALESDAGLELIALVQESDHRSVGSLLVKLAARAAATRVVALRERARELPPTWTETLRKRSALLATGRARWIDISPEDCARLLALAALLQAARSGDVTDARGQPVSEPDVIGWVTSTLAVASWPVLSELAPSAASPARSAAPVSAGEPAPDAGEPPSAPPSSVTRVSAASTLPTLRRLRVASIERLVREVARVDPAATRASVMAELEAASEWVRWLGRSVVYLRLTE